MHELWSLTKLEDFDIASAIETSFKRM